jgi:hypothetical protein
MEDDMSKRAKRDNDPFGDRVAYAFHITSQQQRTRVFDDWIMGKRKMYLQYAELLWLDPDALLLACLIQEEHESICIGGGRGMKATRYDDLLRIAMSYFEDVDNCLKPVDNCHEPVDRIGEKPVDETGTFPHIPRDRAMTENYPHSGELSTGYPQGLSPIYQQSYTQFWTYSLHE